MDYGAILQRAAQITWRHKVLWLFGFLAALYVTRSPNINVNMLPPEAQDQMFDFVTGPSFLPVIAGLFLFFALLGLAVAVLKALGHAALVDQVVRVEGGQPPTFDAGWAAGKKYLWRVFWISLLLGRLMTHPCSI